MIKVIKLKGINNGEPQFADAPFPENELNLENDTRLKAMDDYPFFGLEKGDEFSIYYRSGYVIAGGLSWSVGQLIEEIKRGIWSII